VTLRPNGGLPLTIRCKDAAAALKSGL
jgi:hypothetical protein